MGRRSRDGLDALLPPVASWFRETFGTPTPPQRLGWPAISSGRNTLIFAPTGSGKTLAAFLACLDHLWRTPRATPGVRVLYISPLKALNQDVARNLQLPLDGIVATSARMGQPLGPLHVAVRTGDTTPAERQRLVRRPPDILITTPESLHLMLTSRARETLRHVSHVLVDEIHALASNKRGVFLSLLLERLEALNENTNTFVRVGLSATQRPLDEVARYLGGLRKSSDGKEFEQRPVAIVDAGQRKELDLEVSFPGRAEITPLAGSVWPAIERRLVDLIASHRSSIIFTNNRRVAERLTARLNEHASIVGEDARFIDNEPERARAHHGSLSPERRRSVEEALKAGELRAVVATASLELGIDMGAVDLVCQVESPGSVARGLQRVGRAGHLVGHASKGRLLAKTAGDLLESAALAKAMTEARVEALRVPTNCLDVLAQQIVACVAMDRWSVPDLFDLVRGAYPYRGPSPSAFESVLELVSGRFHDATFRNLRPLVSWDRIHNRLHPLPGTAHRAVVGGGTIPDSGHYPLYLGDNGPKLGELDEEFVLERRIGETFTFGTSTWRIEAIEPQRVVVSPAAGRAGLLPFWRGESAHRTADLGEAVGALTRELAGRLDADNTDTLHWLRSEYHLDEPSARMLRDHVARQVRAAGAAPDDLTVIVETYRDEAGETGLAVLTPFGGRFHHALKLVLQESLRQRLGIAVATLHGDDGVLIRLPGTDDPPNDLFRGLTSEAAERSIRESLGESALFGLRFRQNAGRALLLPRPDPSKRTPLWLQRLRAKDLLQAVRQVPDFPIVVETYRECLQDDLDLPRLRSFLDGVADGSIRVVEHRGQAPSPFASGLIFAFSRAFLYEWDEPRRPDRPDRPPEVTDGMLGPLLDPGSYARWLDPDAVGRVEGRLRGVGRPPRTADEMAEWLRHLGDLAPSDLSGPMSGFLLELRSQGRASTIDLPGTDEPSRWVVAEELPMYAAAFGLALVPTADQPGSGEPSLASILRRYLRTRALVTVADLVKRYPVEPAIAAELLENWSSEGNLVRLDPDPENTDSAPRWADRRNLDEVRRLSIALRRRESVAVTPELFADFVARRQHVHPETRREGPAAVGLVLEQLQGIAATASQWESEILPQRVRDFRPGWLDDALAPGGYLWRAEGSGESGKPPKVAIVSRNFTGNWPAPPSDAPPHSLFEARLLAHLNERGAQFTDALASDLAAPPSRVREALDGLLRRGLVTNDRFDPLRPAGRAVAEALAGADHNGSVHPARGRSGRPRLGASRRRATTIPEGRWTTVASAAADLSPEDHFLAWAEAILDRYGILCRETVAMAPWAPSWRDLFPVLDRAELRGELRRGYFVEGLSGIQYALPDAAEELARLAGSPGPSTAPPVLLPSLDPANLYGSGAPLDVALLEGGTARLTRASSNFVVLIAGRPVLIIEGHGRRLTGLNSASEDDLRAALGLLPGLAGPSRRVLKVETYNLAPALSSPAAPWLSDLGFVRDPPGMAYYAGWT